MNSSDVLIVGAGSAGCVLADQLMRKRAMRVTVVEPPSRRAAKIDRRRPARWIRLLESDEDWNYVTQKSDALAGRALRWPRGRGLGGSSRINAMIWIEPRESDLRRLVDAGGDQWTIDNLRDSVEKVRQLVRPESPRWLSEASRRFLKCADALDDALDDGQAMTYERVNRFGRRWNPASLLGQFSDDPKFSLVRATVDRVMIEGDRAVGVVVQSENSTQFIRCNKHVVLCAGSIASPAILMRSGIGPRDALSNLGIDVVASSPDVGGNLCDHLIMPVIFAMNDRDRFPIASSPRDIVRWQSLATGPLVSNLAECGGLFAEQRLQIHVTPTHYLTHPSDRSPAAMTIGVNVTDPQSRGRLMIGSKDPQDAPMIEPMYLSSPSDLSTTIEGVQLARRIASRPPLAGWLTGELVPGAKRVSDEALAKSIARYGQTLYHPVGTCRVGTGDDSVVDSRLAVRGVDGLSVVDASVLPSATVGNPNATVMMVAHHYGKCLS